jgi:hypothetical protein
VLVLSRLRFNDLDECLAKDILSLVTRWERLGWCTVGLMAGLQAAGIEIPHHHTP